MLVTFLVGLSAGCLFYLIKFTMFYVGTNSPYTKWIWNIAHSGPVWLFVFDIIASMVISSAIKTAGADGLTVLFIFIGFTLCSCLYIIIHVLINKTKGSKLWRNGLSF